MKKLILVLLLVLGIVSLTGCNYVAKNFGGTITIDLEKGQKLTNVSWKDDSLWYLTREMKEGETPDTYTYQQDSNFGVFEGKVIFKEHDMKETKNQ